MELTLDAAEQQWLSRLKGGDQDALRPIFNRHYPLLLGDIYRILADEDLCKDVAQEVFVELWQKRETLEIHTSLRAYLRKAAVNRALNHLKAGKNLIFGSEEEAVNETADPDHADMLDPDPRENMEQYLSAALDALPEKCRLVFSLSRFENMTHKEIAAELNISVKTIENQITKAMKILRTIMIRHRDLSPVVISWLIFTWLA
jgi:RNA polymerase sigma-70 factor (ECF subfamily)